ncbi:hypothetical protein [Halohasta litorea]|uniref:Intracellular proteinase inhibitor n=1 Tax=Halohasta litorea TaxID=869891 RepID=A0ABD6DAC1_9EURY|nr:hypothetical protein [Halohasta litorea]
MHHTRRRYLRFFGGGGSVLIAGLAGCTGGSGPDDSPNETPPETNGSGETRPEGTGGPGVTIASTDEAPDLPVEPTVELVRDTATEDHPPRLRTTLTNTGDEPVSVGEGRAVHFEYVADDSGVLTLLPGDSDSEYPAEADCWRLTEGIAITEEYRTFEIDAGESSSRLVDLYATPDADGCLPVGEYRFESTIGIVGDDAEAESSAAWGFSISLE